MHRLFVAIRPCIETRAQLRGLMGGVPGARWQDDAQLHLTLSFIGAVERPVAEDIAVGLAGISHPPVTLALSGIGSFDRRGMIDALWAGVTPHTAVATLHRKIDQLLVRLGLPPEGRAYLPHITLARLGRAGGDPVSFISAHGGISSAPFTADWFGLYESHLGDEGARYDLIARYPLR